MVRRERYANPIRWLPSLYFTKGMSQVVVMTLSVILFEQLGLENSEITFYVAWLYVPWVIKPLWKPFVDRLHNCRWWLMLTELLLGAGIGGMAFTIPAESWLQGSLFLLWLVAFSSAVHNEALGTLYRRASAERGDAGNDVVMQRRQLVRTISEKLAKVVGQGVLVMLAGNIQVLYRNSIRYSWSLVFYIVAGLLLAAFLYHLYALPNDKNIQRQRVGLRQVWDECVISWNSFVSKPLATTILLFLVFFRLPEALLGKMSILFLLDSMHNGGLGLSPQEYGLVMGTVAVIGLTIGNVFGTRVLHRDGLRRWMWWMACAMTLPDVGYVVLSYLQPENLAFISLWLFVEQMGYGVGFAFYLSMLNKVSQPSVNDSHRTLAKAIMAFSMMIPTMLAGILQSLIGYHLFFIIVLLLCLVTFVVTALSNRLFR